MPHNTVAVVGAAETTRLGVIPELSQIGLHDSLMMCKCLFSRQCPVRILVSLLTFLRLSERRYFDFFALILMQLFDCLA